MSIQPPKSIRVNASTVIVRDGAILLAILDDDESGIHYNLPGGGVEPGESIQEAALREAWEETGAHVTIGRLLLIWEYIPTQHEYRYGSRQKVSFCFEAHLVPGSEPQFPNLPDGGQIGIRWVPLSELGEVELVPQIAKSLIEALSRPASDGPLTPIVNSDL